MNNLTQNKNYLSPTGFKVTIASNEFANLEYFCTSTSIPALSIGEIATPFQSQQAYVPGDRLEYAPFEMNFILSENMENYIEIYNWIRANTQENKFKYCDIILHILTSSNTPNKKIRYVDAFPVSVSAIQFITQNTNVEYATSDVTFRYTRFEFI
jgi:hypothetical protein